MTERPPDVPAAMREAFADRRVAAAWNMFSVSDGPNQAAALGGLVRLLEKRGLTLSDVAIAVTTPMIIEKRGAASFADVVDGMGSAFDEVRARARRAADAATVHRPMDRRHVQGRDIPETITGVVRISATEPNRTGMVTTFHVDSVESGRTTTYGPITAISESIRSSLSRAADATTPRRVTISIRRPMHAMQNPSARRIVFET